MNRIEPGPGQESVWDYPRPPLAVPSSRRVRVIFAGVVIAESTRAMRVLETSHPPVWYVPREDVRTEYLVRSSKASFCEFKGSANYWDVKIDGRCAANAAWSYQQPAPAFAKLAGYFAFYPARVDECFVDDERVKAQPSDFYGGWITSDIAGPFKGERGTSHW